MTAQEANNTSLNSIISQDNLEDVFCAIKNRAKNGRGDLVYPYSKPLMYILPQLGYYCYPTNDEKMVIAWNVQIENYWSLLNN